MMNNSLYLQWIIDKVYNKNKSYNKLYCELGSIIFVAEYERDENRIGDAISMRKSFYNEYGIEILGPVTVLEVMVALARRMERDIFDDDDFGDRTPIWFELMLKALEIENMEDNNFNIEYVDNCINKFMHHQYLPNGLGSLFVTTNKNIDMTKLEIWQQMIEWTNTINIIY